LSPPAFRAVTSQTGKLGSCIAGPERTDFRRADVVADMDAEKEQSKKRRRHAATHEEPNRRRSALPSRFPSGRGIDRDREQQATPARNAIQKDVSRLTRANRNKPLEPFIQGAHDHAGHYRQQNQHSSVRRAARAMKQPRQ
jgi:hypothetical protein